MNCWSLFFSGLKKKAYVKLYYHVGTKSGNSIWVANRYRRRCCPEDWKGVTKKAYQDKGDAS